MPTLATETVSFVGGPCGGVTKQVPEYVTATGTVVCSGAYYTISPGQTPPLTARFVAPTPGPSGPGASSVTAYRDLTGAVDQTLPNQLGAAARTTRAALRLLGSRGKVR